MKRLWLLYILFLGLLTGCNIATAPAAEVALIPFQPPVWVVPADSQVADVRTIVVKMVAEPRDRVQDFTVIQLDGTHQVHFMESQCMLDNPSYMFGHFNSVKHCPILQPDIAGSLITDQAWLDDDLAPFRQYLNCINGWVYLGRDESGQETWFIEMFGFQAFC